MRLGSLVLICLVGATPAFADEAVRTGAAAFGDWRTDAPGVRRLITPADLPAPFATRSTANMSQHETWTEADVPKAPPGFAVDLFATGLDIPRVIRIAPNGDIFVAETGAGRVRVFHAAKAGAPGGAGRNLRRRLATPVRDRLLPGRIRSEVCLYRDARLCPSNSLSQWRHHGLGPRGNHREPAEGGGHWTRDLAFSADDKTMFVSVGSGSNVDEGVPRADQASIAKAPLGSLVRRRAAPRRRAGFRSRRQKRARLRDRHPAIVQALRAGAARAPESQGTGESRGTEESRGTGEGRARRGGQAGTRSVRQREIPQRKDGESVSVSQVLGSLGVPEGTASDGTVDTSINLHNVTQLKDLVDLGLSPEQRAQHAAALLDGITAPAGQPGVSLLHRLIGHVVGNDELSQQDHAQLAAALPITAHVTTQVTPGGTAQTTPDGTDQTAAAGTAPTAAGGTAQTATGGTASPPAGPPMQVSAVWDVSTPDGSLRVIDLPNGIELLDGGCIVARSTPLHFTCSSLTRAGAPPAGYSGDFNILGTTGAPVATPAQPPGRAQAPSGAPGTCVSASVAGEGGGNGAPGQQGTAGAAARGATTASPARWLASPSPAA